MSDLANPSDTAGRSAPRVPFSTIAREWFRLGCIGFGGPPTHIALLRRLCVEDRQWIGAKEFEDAIATTNLLPGPASTQLAIFCAWRLRRSAGALLGGVCFILPGLVLILALSAVFLASNPPDWISARRRERGPQCLRLPCAQRGDWCRPVVIASGPEMLDRFAGLSTPLLGAPLRPPSAPTWFSSFSPVV